PLTHSHRRATEPIRDAHAREVVSLEPPLTRTLGARAHPEPVGDTNLAYAPHLYTTTFGLPDLKYTGDRAAMTADYTQAVAEASEQGAVLWVGEYGGNTSAGGGVPPAAGGLLPPSPGAPGARGRGFAVSGPFPARH